MAFFDYNEKYEDGHQYLYQQFPEFYVFAAKTRKWKIRERGFAIGRMYSASPFMGEKFYLRLLLTVVRGPQSFAYLQTIHGIEHSTFKAACNAFGLLDNDDEWISCFQEAILFASGHSLRLLFSTALLFNAITDPHAL